MNLSGNEQLLKNINDMISSATKVEDIESIQSYIDSILSDARKDLENSFNPENSSEDDNLREFVSSLERMKRNSIEKKNKLNNSQLIKENNEELSEEIEILDEDKEPTIKLPKMNDEKQKTEVLIDEDKEPTVELPDLEAIQSAKKLTKELEEIHTSNAMKNINSLKNIENLEEEKNRISDEYNKLNSEAFENNLYNNREILDKLTNMKNRLTQLDNEMLKLEPNNKSSNDDSFKNSDIENVKNINNKDTGLELKNIKCIYKPSLNVWQISAETNMNKVYSKMYSVNKERLYSNNDIKYDANMIKKYNLDNASAMDYSLTDALEQFDREMHTDILERYATNTFDGDVIYDLRGLFKTPKQMLSTKEKIQIMKNAKNQKESRNAEVYYMNTRKAKQAVGESIVITPLQKAAIGTALGATVAAASLSSNSKSNNQNNLSDNKNIENNQQEVNSKLEKNKLSSFNEKEPEILSSNLKETNKIENINNDKKYIDMKDITNTNSDINIFENGNASKGIKLGDKLDLDNVVLTYDSNGASPRANTNTLNFEYYKMCYVAILKDGKVIDVFDKSKIDQMKDRTLEDIKKEYEDKYGNTVIEVNVNGYYDDKNYIKNQGWVNMDDIKLKENVNSLIR